jgi:hypothetical protein
VLAPKALRDKLVLRLKTYLAETQGLE